MYHFFTQIIEGWKECIYNYQSWKYMLEAPYDDYTTWEFFSYMNQEIQKPYTIYLSIEDYDKLLELLESDNVQS